MKRPLLPVGQLAHRVVAKYAWLALAATLAACSSDPRATSLKFVESGDAYVQAGKLAEAIIEYRNAVQSDPVFVDARIKLADAYIANREPATAIDEYVRAADLRLDDTVLLLKTGTLLLMTGRFDEAKGLAEKVVAREAGNADAHTLLANSLAGLTQFDLAVSQIEEAIRLDPSRGEIYSNLGALELGRGEKAAAEAAFKKAIELAPASTTAHLALANFYWVDGRRESAEAHFKTVIEIDPKSVLAHRALASFYTSTNRPSEAEGHLKRVVELTGSPAASIALADFQVAQGNEVAARNTLRPLNENPSTSAAAEVRLATLDYADGRKQEGYARLESILARDRSHLDALVVRANLLLADRQSDAALADATVASEKHPTSAAAFYAVGRVQTARRQPQAAIAAYEEVLRLNPRATDAKLALARLHLSEGRPDSSLGLTREVVDSQPRNAEARLTAARAMLARKDLRGAEQELTKLLSEFPDSPAVHVQMGVLSGLKRDEPAARSHFERALKLNPESLEAFGGLIAVDIGAKRVAGVRARLDQRLATHGSDPATLLIAARAFATIGDMAKAEDALRRVIEVDPNLLDAYGLLAQVLVRQQRLDAALAEFDALAKRDPRPIAALTFAGIILQGQGRNDRAIERFRSALELDPEAAVAANNLAWIYATSDGNLDSALQLAQTARRRLPDNPAVTNTLGFVYYKKDLLDLAIPELRASVDKVPDNATYQHHLGLAYAKAGDRQRAVQHLGRALQLKNDFDGATEARALLQSLGVQGH